MLKIGWNIANNDSSTAANPLQALALINDSYKYLMDLTTNGVVVTDAIKYVQGKVYRLNKTEEAIPQDKEYKEESEEQEQQQEHKTYKLTKYQIQQIILHMEVQFHTRHTLLYRNESNVRNRRRDD